ncbi:MAG: cation-translocating P-type ATPase [Saprospiraceae bacterium]|nr:cation-translocating P-type ATPase [Saprospiraceae bacterium]
MEQHRYQGLSHIEVLRRRALHGENFLNPTGRPAWLEWLLPVVSEPLFLILVLTAALYFLLGENGEGTIMLVALAFVSGISLFQENRSRKAERALRGLLEPRARVYRTGALVSIPYREIVVGDVLVVEDGDVVPADGVLLESHDLTIDESLLTGESASLYKGMDSEDRSLFQGTQVLSGYGVAEVVNTGRATRFGAIHVSMESIRAEKTPIQVQIQQFVRRMVQLGLVAFLAIWAIHSAITQNLVYGLLKGLTLSMSLLPEEIPVAFSTFMALGAMHLYRKKVLVKTPSTVEALGAVTVICLDKTGTITENEMRLCGLYDVRTGQITTDIASDARESDIVECAMWASETEPFDPMERSIHAMYAATHAIDRRKEFTMIREYPLSGKPPVMTHVFANGEGETMVACKGGLESVMAMCELTDGQREALLRQSAYFGDLGHRILAIARGLQTGGPLPDDQFAIRMEMLGLISFVDPPKSNMHKTLQAFREAGIRVKILSGDYANTTLAIARQLGMEKTERSLTGEEVLRMSPGALNEELSRHSVFARMFPEAKLRVIEALKRTGEIVAMTGDGVNDAPALKAAHIGIAMGQRGSELARKTSSLILADDDISRMVDGIALGRRIYENLKKAIQYIISIHIPIILIVTIPVVFLWEFTDFFTPVHVIFLELIMGPTCSILFENEPIEPRSMQQPPRKFTADLFTWRELSTSMVQGLVITAVCLGLAWYCLMRGDSEARTRTLLYTSLVFSNIFLTLVNRSFIESAFATLRYRNALVPVILGLSLAALLLTLYHPGVRTLFLFEPLAPREVLLCMGLGFVAVGWMEVVKWRWRRKVLRSAP